MRVWMQDAFFDCIVLMPGFLSPCHAWPNSWSIIFGNIYIMCWWSKSVQHVRDKRLSVPPNNAVSTSDHRSSEALHRVYNVTWMWKRSHKHADREYGVCSAWKKKKCIVSKVSDTLLHSLLSHCTRIKETYLLRLPATHVSVFTYLAFFCVLVTAKNMCLNRRGEEFVQCKSWASVHFLTVSIVTRRVAREEDPFILALRGTL